VTSLLGSFLIFDVSTVRAFLASHSQTAADANREEKNTAEYSAAPVLRLSVVPTLQDSHNHISNV